MTPLDITHIALVVVGGLSVLLWALPGPCRCEKCSFHVNEQRVSRMREAEAAHDAQHKGFGFRAGTPDRYHCSDDECSRNPKA